MTEDRMTWWKSRKMMKTEMDYVCLEYLNAKRQLRLVRKLGLTEAKHSHIGRLRTIEQHIYLGGL